MPGTVQMTSNKRMNSQRPRVEPNRNGKEINTMKGFLMIFCCIARLMPCPVVIRESSSSSRWEKVQRCTARHHVERESKLEDSTGFLPLELRRGGRILSESKGTEDTRRAWLTESTKQGPYGLTVT